MKQTIVKNTVIMVGVTTLFTLALLSALVYFNLQKRYQDLRKSTILAIGRDAVVAIENGLNLGIHCKELHSIPSLLAKQAKSVPFLKDMMVYDENGVLLHTTDPKTDSLLDLKLMKKIQDQPFEQDHSSVLGTLYIPLKNSYDVTDGILALSYNRYAPQEFNSLRIFFAALVLIVSAVLTFLSIIPIRMILAPVQETLSEMTDAIAGNPISDNSDAQIVKQFRDEAVALAEKMEQAAHETESVECR